VEKAMADDGMNAEATVEGENDKAA